jgi:peptide/nickel transport system substrate-binding protein
MLTSCTGPGKEKLNKEVFRYNESAGITSLEPAFANNQANIWACNQLFNGLVQQNDQLQPIPCIARLWEVSEDGINTPSPETGRTLS